MLIKENPKLVRIYRIMLLAIIFLVTNYQLFAQKDIIEVRAKLMVIADLTQFADITILDSNTFSFNQNYLNLNELKTSGLYNIRVFEISFYSKFKRTTMTYYISYNEIYKRFYRLNGFIRNELDDFINSLCYEDFVMSMSLDISDKKWSKNKRLRYIFNQENVSIEKLNLKKLYNEFNKNGLIYNSCYYNLSLIMY